MTIDQLFKVLKDVPFQLVGSMNHIRYINEKGLRVCPLSAACNKLHGTDFTGSIYIPAAILGISHEEATIISEAADRDRPVSLSVKALRERMMRELIK